MAKTPEEMLEENNEHAERIMSNESMNVETRENVESMMIALQLERLISAINNLGYYLEKIMGRMP